MKKISVLLVLLICSFCMKSWAQMAAPEPAIKVVLPLFVLQDTNVESALKEINTSILKKDSGFLWPVTKITFSKQAEELLVDVVAIDNSWCKLLDVQGEDLYGYVVCNNRMFVIAGKGDDLPLAKLFAVTDAFRSFVKPNLAVVPPSNPTWHYKYASGTCKLLEAENLDALGK